MPDATYAKTAKGRAAEVAANGGSPIAREVSQLLVPPRAPFPTSTPATDKVNKKPWDEQYEHVQHGTRHW